jgi:hypothetical protein
VYGELADGLGRAAHTAGSPVARLRAALRAYIEIGLANPSRYRMAFMTALAPHVDGATFLDQGTQAWKGFDIMRPLVTAVLRTPEPQAVETTLQALWALVHGVVALVVEHPHFPSVPRERLVDRSLELVINGIGPGGRANGAAARAAGRRGKRRALTARYGRAAE